MYDYVIKNGLIVDGTGAKPYKGDVCIKNEKIDSIVDHYDGNDETIDINGLVIAPGFIDIHSHSDICPLSNDLSESKVFQGITTELVGHCGISVIPSSKENKHLVKKYINNHLQSNSKDVDWEAYSITDYAKVLDGYDKSINWASLVGHGTLRACVMGFDNRKPTIEEMEKMKMLLDREIKAGAFGMSVGLIYPPGSFSDTEELIELAKVIKANDATLTAHIRGESDLIFTALNEMIEVARKSNVHLHISHLKLMGINQWGRADELLNIIYKAREEGLNISCDQYPYDASSTSLTALVPKWAHEGGIDKMVERLNGPEVDRIKKEILIEMKKRGGPDRVQISSTYGRFADVDGKTMSKIAKELKMSYEDAVVEILIKSKGSVAAIYFSMNEEDVIRIMREKDISVGSDGYAFIIDSEKVKGIPHPRNFGTFPRFLKMVRQNKLMPLEDAIYKITGLSAKLMGFNDRGTIAEGSFADLVVFDPENINDKSTFKNPFVKSEGIHHVFVSGKPVILDQIQTEERNGKVILK